MAQLIRVGELERAMEKSGSYNSSGYGQLRLSEVREEFEGSGFEQAVVHCVRQGEIALIPVGDVVHIKTQVDRLAQ